MRSIFKVLFLAMAFSPLLSAKAVEPMPLKYSAECILEAALKRKNQKFNPAIPVPAVFLESTTPLKQFQDAIEPQWGIRPERFTNAYALARNEIYLMDDSSYYVRNGRYVDDSLAHEFTHFIQAKYQHFDLNDESLEADAIDVQTWFRDEFMKTGKSPCAK